MNACRRLPTRLLGILILSCMAGLLTQCAHRDAPSTQAPKLEWYVASREPLTYCPKGQQLPRAGTSEIIGAEYIYLADRKTRFHIPRECLAHRKQALELRAQSNSCLQKSAEATEEAINALLSFSLIIASGLAR